VSDDALITPLHSVPAWLEGALDQWSSPTHESHRGHAYLIVSDDPYEAALFCELLTARLLCSRIGSVEPCRTCAGCRAHEQGAHGDVMQIVREPGKQAIGVDQVREATRFMQQTALYGDTKLLFIRDAETMTTAASNSLLKTLEEPPGASLILLSTAAAWRLPATVRSRCQRIRLPVATAEAALQWLDANMEVDRVEAAALLAVTRGHAVAVWRHRADSDLLDRRALAETFPEVAAAQGPIHLPQAWGAADPEVLLFELLVWLEAQCERADAATLRAAGRGDLILHRCLSVLSGRIRSGVTPAREVIVAEIFRLFRSRGHSDFPAIADRFLTSLGRDSVAV